MQVHAWQSRSHQNGGNTIRDMIFRNFRAEPILIYADDYPAAKDKTHARSLNQQKNVFRCKVTLL